MAKDDEDAQDRKDYIARVLDDPEKGMMLFTGFMMAAMAGGKSANDAGKQADQALAEVKRRFT